MFLFLMLAVPPFITKIILGIWAWFSAGPWTWLDLLNTRPVLFLPLPIRYADLCVNTLWQTGHTLLCSSLKRMLLLLACIVVKYGVLFFCRQAGSSLARCLRFICIFWRARYVWSSLPLFGMYSENVDMNRCKSTGFGQLSSFSIVCLIPIVTLCGG